MSISIVALVEPNTGGSYVWLHHYKKNCGREKYNGFSLLKWYNVVSFVDGFQANSLRVTEIFELILHLWRLSRPSWGPGGTRCLGAWPRPCLPRRDLPSLPLGSVYFRVTLLRRQGTNEAIRHFRALVSLCKEENVKVREQGRSRKKHAHASITAPGACKRALNLNR